MQHLPQGVKDEEGCFVYQLLKPLDVRSQQNVGDEYKTGKVFNPGELVSVDLFRPSRLPDSTNGPFLRLADQSGWLFEKKFGDVVMRRIPVESGLWCFYVDNTPTGIILRSHPVDRKDVRVPHIKNYSPMQKIYCDRKVKQSHVSYYRVQGTEGWVFDKRVSPSINNILIPEHLVKTGLFVYENISSIGIGIRDRITVDLEYTTGMSVAPGELVAADMVTDSPTQPGGPNGSYARLTDGSGWVFEYKDGEKLMDRLPIVEGKWRFRVENAPAGIGLRRQPIDSQNFLSELSYAPGEEIECTHKVQASSGAAGFY